MYESFIMISDVGCMPDYRGEWPKLAVARVETEERVGMLTLGKLECTSLISESTTVIDFTYEIQYFNFDSGDMFEPESKGTIAILDVNPLYVGKECPVQLCCEDISEAVFGTHVAFDTLPVLDIRK